MSNISQRTHPIHPIGQYTDVLLCSYYLGAFGAILLPYETRCKTGRTSAKVRETKSHRNFSQRMHPIHPIGPKTDILVRFILFGCIRDCLVAYETRCKTGRTRAKVRATKSRRTFRKERTRSTPLDNILTFWCVRTIWVHSGLFSCLTKLVAKRAEQVQKFVPQSRVGIFLQQTHPIHPIGL